MLVRARELVGGSVIAVETEKAGGSESGAGLGPGDERAQCGLPGRCAPDLDGGDPEVNVAGTQ